MALPGLSCDMWDLLLIVVTCKPLVAAPGIYFPYQGMNPGQLSQAFAVEAKCEEKVQGKAHRAGNRESEKRTQQKAQEIQPQFPEDLRLR